jgi:transcriptional regulator with PAS, ATPase and Fis domain
VIPALQQYHWPGNVRELENTLERAVVLTTGSTIVRSAIWWDQSGARTTGAVPSLKLQQNVEWMECTTISQALGMSTEKQEAARLLGISPRALSYYLSKYPFLDRKRVEKGELVSGLI